MGGERTRRWVAFTLGGLAVVLAACGGRGAEGADGDNVRQTEAAISVAPQQKLAATKGRGRVVSFGTSKPDAEVLRAVSITNAKKVPATKLAAVLSGGFGWAGGAYPGAGGTCGDGLAPGASCTVVLHFEPPGSGTYLGELRLTYELRGRAAELDVPLKGTRKAPPPPPPAVSALPGDTVVVTPTCSTSGCSANMALVRLTKVTAFSASTCDGAWDELESICAQYGAHAPVTNSAHMDGWGCDQWFSSSHGKQLETSDAWNPTGAWMYGTLGTPFVGGRVWIVAGEPTWLSKATYPALGAGDSLMTRPEAIAWESYHPMTGGNWETISSGTAEIGDWILCATNEARAAQPLTSAKRGAGKPVAFGSVFAGQSATRTIMLRNGKRVAATDLSFELPPGVTFAGGSPPGEGGTCEKSLDVGKTCTVALTWAAGGDALAADMVVSYKYRDAAAALALPLVGAVRSPEAPPPDPPPAEPPVDEKPPEKPDEKASPVDEKASDKVDEKASPVDDASDYPPPEPGPLPKGAIPLKPQCGDESQCGDMVLVQVTQPISIGAKDCVGMWKNLAAICAAHGATAPTTGAKDWADPSCEPWFAGSNPSAPVTSDQWNPTAPWMYGTLGGAFPGGRIWMASGYPEWLSRAIYPTLPEGKQLMADPWAISWESYHPMTGGNWETKASGTIDKGDWVLCASTSESPKNGPAMQNALRGRADGGPLGWIRDLVRWFGRVVLKRG